MQPTPSQIGRDFLAAWEKGEIGTALRIVADAADAEDPVIANALRSAATSAQPPVAVIKAHGGVVQGTFTNMPGLDVLILDYDIEGLDPADLVSIPEIDGDARDARRLWSSPLHSAGYANDLVYVVDTHDQPAEGGPDAALERIPPYDRNGKQTKASMLAWFQTMHAKGLAFHPEDDPADVVSGAYGARVFTDVEANELRLTLRCITHAFGTEVVCKTALDAILPRRSIAG